MDRINKLIVKLEESLIDKIQDDTFRQIVKHWDKIIMKEYIEFCGPHRLVHYRVGREYYRRLLISVSHPALGLSLEYSKGIILERILHICGNAHRIDELKSVNISILGNKNS